MATTLNLADQESMALIIERLASQILETFAKLDHLVLIGIERRGVDLARRLVQIIQKRSGK
ncbi:MAG: bifunctional pyr operon transcriptional regulator/uracil phosphoribosyltransferase, partial [Desulfovibrio sp.]|nr:bifunctional pyr operon transcriptional regulator/uracil phosphoribosyltransferase [Desulfovibrio sp.]